MANMHDKGVSACHDQFKRTEGSVTRGDMVTEADKRELLEALRACLLSADGLGLMMVGIHLSYAIDYLLQEDAVASNPPMPLD